MSRIAIVTGAGSGIGRAVSLALAEDGYSVMLAGRREVALLETARMAPTKQVVAIPTDITKPASVKALFSATKARFGHLDLLFNNAGASAPSTSLEDVSYDVWQTVVETNLTGTFLCTQEAIRLMKAQSPPGGRIINNGSIGAQVPRPQSCPSTATKHAITGLTKITSLEGRNFGIACGQIDIGNADTSMTKQMKAGVLQADGRTAIEPTIDVKEVARAVLYMASLPLEGNILSMTIMATKMPFIGRG